jgi:hypothetical protein
LNLALMLLFIRSMPFSSLSVVPIRFWQQCQSSVIPCP